MYDRMQTLDESSFQKIHNATMEILENTGVTFNESEALSIFKENGFKVEGSTVFFKEADIKKAIDSAPSRFKVHARNPEKSVTIGEDDFVFLPAYGAPFIAEADGSQRPGTMEDYDNFCKLVQTSPHLNMNGYIMVEPSDVPPETSGLDMVLSNILLCDKPFMGCQTNKEIARDLVEMCAIVFCGGDKEKLKEMPVSVSLINALSPLQFSEEMVGALVELARYGQPMVIANMVMGGTSGPVTLPGMMAVINAEVLAGLCLAQVINPGTPVIYGSTSTPTHMKTGTAAVGSPETAMLISMTAQMARFYNLPCRSGGGLNDSHVVDAQAACEATMNLMTAARNGVNFVLHACGQMAGHISMSFEKFMVDEEFCGMLRRMFTPMAVNDETLDLETIKTVGIGGHYLMQPSTFKRCRTEYHSQGLFNRDNFDSWTAAGSKSAAQAASDKIAQRLESYERPEIDSAIENALRDYVASRKA
ncbi:MAG: trimethylamine methyltransferase family protein [Desulfobacter sp.]|nr:MAG: trimethylamine methyltransferase family protein [Desulfobacter sp.]